MWFFPIAPPDDDFVHLQTNFLKNLPNSNNDIVENVRNNLVAHLSLEITHSSYEAGSYYTPFPDPAAHFELWKASLPSLKEFDEKIRPQNEPKLAEKKQPPTNEKNKPPVVTEKRQQRVQDLNNHHKKVPGEGLGGASSEPENGEESSDDEEDGRDEGQQKGSKIGVVIVGTT